MLPILDDPAKIDQFDKGKMLASVRMLPDQIEQAWEGIKGLEVSKSCLLAENVIISGMGGSALGGRILDSLLADRIRVPIEIFTQYDLPDYVDRKSLVIICSYSGNTEESVSALHQALLKKANIFCIATGGKLSEIAKKEKLDGYIYEPKANPSGQPRMGLGYSISATISILARCKFARLTEEDIYNLAVTVRNFVKQFDTDVPKDKNIAKSLALKLYHRIPVLIASGHLVGVTHAFKNQLNENAKTFSASFDIPELNHHLMEGLKHPSKAKELLTFLFLESEIYPERIKKRFKITEDVVDKNSYPYLTYKPASSSKLEQIFEVLTLSSYLSFYLAYLYEEDPSVIPWVDYFKEQLAK
jgi:glucose/mannose-6-phosphate isomerase